MPFHPPDVGLPEVATHVRTHEVAHQVQPSHTVCWRAHTRQRTGHTGWCAVESTAGRRPSACEESHHTGFISTRCSTTSTDTAHDDRLHRSNPAASPAPASRACVVRSSPAGTRTTAVALAEAAGVTPLPCRTRRNRAQRAPETTRSRRRQDQGQWVAHMAGGATRHSPTRHGRIAESISFVCPRRATGRTSRAREQRAAPFRCTNSEHGALQAPESAREAVRSASQAPRSRAPDSRPELWGINGILTPGRGLRLLAGVC